jgi:hypothetical protein
MSSMAESCRKLKVSVFVPLPVPPVIANAYGVQTEDIEVPARSITVAPFHTARNSLFGVLVGQSSLT